MKHERCWLGCASICTVAMGDGWRLFFILRHKAGPDQRDYISRRTIISAALPGINVPRLAKPDIRIPAAI